MERLKKLKDLRTTLSADRRRWAATILSITLSVAILFSGTYAWVSASQVAYNEISGTPNPGGRVHDDYDKENKDVYAENFGTVPLFVRVRLNEYMETSSGAGLKGTAGTPNPSNLAKPFVPGTTIDDKTKWPVHIPGATVADCDQGPTDKIHDYISWKLGGSKVFMPTYNKDLNDLSTDASGVAIDAITAGQTAVGKDDAAGNHNDGSHDYWAAGDTVTANVHYWDAAANSGAGAPAVTGNVTHTAKYTLLPDGSGVMTMAEWKTAGSPLGNFWVYDTDGWAYWANELAPGEATSLLLNGIEVVSPDEDWYYCIDVTGQFATQTDLNKFGEDGEVITADAITLLDAIIAAKNNTPVIP